MANLPEHIINKIMQYKPNDKDMKSPSSKCINPLIVVYKRNARRAADVLKAMYLTIEYEPFYKHALRVNKDVHQFLKHFGIPFSKAHLYFNADDDATAAAERLGRNGQSADE